MNLTNFSKCIISHVALDFDKSFRNIFSLLLPAFRHDVFNPFNLNAKTSWEVKTRAKCTNRQRAYALFIMIFEAFNGAVSHSWAVIFQRGLFIVVLYIPSLNKLSIQPCKLVYRNHFFCLRRSIREYCSEPRYKYSPSGIYSRKGGMGAGYWPIHLRLAGRSFVIFSVHDLLCFLFSNLYFCFSVFKSFYNPFHIFSFPLSFLLLFHFYSFSVIFI